MQDSRPQEGSREALADQWNFIVCACAFERESVCVGMCVK